MQLPSTAPTSRNIPGGAVAVASPRSFDEQHLADRRRRRAAAVPATWAMVSTSRLASAESEALLGVAPAR